MAAARRALHHLALPRRGESLSRPQAPPDHGADSKRQVIRPTRGPDAEQTLATGPAQSAQVASALQALPERQRAALVLSYYEGLSKRRGRRGFGAVGLRVGIFAGARAPRVAPRTGKPRRRNRGEGAAMNIERLTQILAAYGAAPAALARGRARRRASLARAHRGVRHGAGARRVAGGARRGA